MTSDITKMITISTEHIRAETAKIMETIPNHEDFPPYFEKKNYGWFIYIGNKDLINEEKGLKSIYPNIPKDLSACMELAKNKKCEWLCLDCDGPIEETLPLYKW